MLAAWLHTIFAVVVFLAVRSIPMPGVDGPYTIVAASGILLLVVIRAGAALLAHARARQLACAVYLALSAGRGFLLATSLTAGLRVHLLIAVTAMAAASVEWALADWISKRGIGRGPLVLFAVVALLDTGLELSRFGAAAGRDGIDSTLSLIQLASGIPAALVLFALSRRGAIEWPMPVRGGWVLTSPIDLLILPYLAGRVAASVVPAMIIPWLPQLETIVALASAAGITVWLIGRPARGIRPGYFAAAVLAPLLSIVPVAAAIAADRDATLLRFLGRGRGFEGTSRFDVLLSAEGGDGVRDAPILVQRLDALGVKAKIAEAALGRVRLRLTGSEDVGRALPLVLMRGKLAIAPIAVDQGVLEPNAETRAKYPALSVEQDADGTSHYLAQSKSELDGLLATIPKDSRAAIERQLGGYVPYLLEEPVLTDRDVNKAHVATVPEMGRPYIQVQLTRAAAKRFSELTARMANRKLAIVLDGEILSAPVVQSRIEGGRVHVTLNGEGTIDEQHADARATAAALESRAMSREWSLASIVAASD